MGWFSIGIDPLLCLLERGLQGIVICSFPQLEERYKVYGLADDVKASVSTMAEFSLIENSVRLFELNSPRQCQGEV